MIFSSRAIDGNSKRYLRRSIEFLLIVGVVLGLQYLSGSYAKVHLKLADDKIAEALLSTFSSALTLLLSTWVAYQISSARQHEDAAMRRKENVMGFYNDMSSPEFVKVRRNTKLIFKTFFSQNKFSFKEFHAALSQEERSNFSSLMLLFRKLHLGLNNGYFDLPAVLACFGDEIVIWHDGCLDKALSGLNWPSEIAVRRLYESVRSHATEEQTTFWDNEAREFAADMAAVLGASTPELAANTCDS